jgi:glycosyl-4,4'-diaponeurosporenoate acyltransferase
VKLLICAVYLAVIGILSYVIGKKLPRAWFDSDQRPFPSYTWEGGGTVYNRLCIRKWKDKLPDMSKIMPGLLPKRLAREGTGRNLERLIRETCVAEAIHIFLMILGGGCLFIWPGQGGIIVTMVWALGNIPFILIQRYNRPRMKKLSGQLNDEKKDVIVSERNKSNEGSDFDMQYGRRA